MQNRVLLSSLLYLLTACSGGDTVAYRIPFTLVNNNLGVQHGTAHDDVWMIGGDGKDAQEDPFDTRVEYWNGTTAASVPLSLDVFREGACGMPSTSAAVTRGEIWLGSFHVPNCGISPPTSYDTLIFGKLKSDGTWEDHSADFPTGPIGPAKKLDLQERDGVLYVGVEYGVPSTSYKLFRYAADGTHTELPLPDIHRQSGGARRRRAVFRGPERRPALSQRRVDHDGNALVQPGVTSREHRRRAMELRSAP